MLNYGWECVRWDWCSYTHAGVWDMCTEQLVRVSRLLSIHSLYLCHMGMNEYVQQDGCMSICMDRTCSTCMYVWVVRPYVWSYVWQDVHKYGRTCSTCMYVTRRLYVRALRKSSRHSSPSRLLTKTYILISIIIFFIFFFLSWVFFSDLLMRVHISLQHSSATSQFHLEIVFNLPSNVLQLLSLFPQTFYSSNRLSITLTSLLKKKL